VVTRFLEDNNLKRIVRAHEWMFEGHSEDMDGRMTTVFTSSDYFGCEATHQMLVAALGRQVDGYVSGVQHVPVKVETLQKKIDSLKTQINKAAIAVLDEEQLKVVSWDLAEVPRIHYSQGNTDSAPVSLLDTLELFVRIQIFKHNEELHMEFLNTGKTELSLQEWAACMEQVMPDVDVKWLEVPHMLDIHEDTVKWESFLESMMPPDTMAAVKGIVSSSAELQLLFHLMDADSDGKISLAEMEATRDQALEALKGGAGRERVQARKLLRGLKLRELFENLDADGDGTISAREFTVLLGQQQKGEENADQMATAFI